MPKFRMEDFPNTVWETLERSSVQNIRCSVIRHTSDVWITEHTVIKTDQLDKTTKIHSAMENLERRLPKESREYVHKKFKYFCYENKRKKTL